MPRLPIIVTRMNLRTFTLSAAVGAACHVGLAGGAGAAALDRRHARHARSRARISRDGDLPRRPPRHLGRRHAVRTRPRSSCAGPSDARPLTRPSAFAVRPPSTTAAASSEGERRLGARRSHRSHFCRTTAPAVAATAVRASTSTATGPARRVTSVKGQLEHPRWSPDGKRLAVLFVAGSAQETGALVAYKPDAGVVGETVEEQRIAIVDAAGGELREVSPRRTVRLRLRLVAGRPGVRGGGGRTDRARTTTGSAQLYVVRRRHRQDARRSGSRRCRSRGPRWSPDGKSIAVIHGIMSDEGSTGGDVYAGSGCGRRRAEHHAGPRGLGAAGSPGGRAATSCSPAHVDGESALGDRERRRPARARRSGAAPQQLLTLLQPRPRRPDASAAVVSRSQQAPEVCAGPIGALEAR